MSLINWKPRNMWLDFPRWTDDFFDDELQMTGLMKDFTMPAVNITEDDKHFTLEVAAPGMNKKDFKLHVENGVLIVEAEAKQTKEEKDENYRRKEFSYNKFKRSFWLPENVNADAIKAEYKNGLLLLSLPKKVTAKKSMEKTIEIA